MFAKPLRAMSLLLVLTACMTGGAMINYGNDSSDYANDGECDDPRFTGGGMSKSLRTDNVEADATDCRKLHEAGAIRPARTRAQWTVDQCAKLDFGSNSSQWARDGECDDPRFTGPGADDIMLPVDKGHDAQDCRAACLAGEVWPK